jgi:hypothetical protein
MVASGGKTVKRFRALAYFLGFNHCTGTNANLGELSFQPS